MAGAAWYSRDQPADGHAEASVGVTDANTRVAETSQVSWRRFRRDNKPMVGSD